MEEVEQKKFDNIKNKAIELFKKNKIIKSPIF
jgi:hypothetical protein